MAAIDTLTEVQGQSTLAIRAALPALLIGAIALGMSGVYVKLAETGPLATAFYRFLFALPVFLAILPVEGRSAQLPARLVRRDWWLLVGAGVFFACDMAAFNAGLVYTNVANATLLGNMAVVFVTLGAWLLFKERITWRFLAGMAVALAGAIILMSDSLSFRPEQLPGDALSLVAAMFYTAYLLCVARLRSRISTVRIMFWSSAVGAIVLLPVSLMTGEVIWAASWLGWLVLVAMGLGSHALGQGLVAYALAHLPTSFSSVALLVQPVAAAFFAWLILSESLAPLQAAGGAIVLLGILLARLATVRRKPS